MQLEEELPFCCAVSFMTWLPVIVLLILLQFESARVSWSKLLMWNCVGEGDTDEYYQSQQGPAGRHGRRSAHARGPASQGDTAERLPGEDTRLWPGKTALNQPRSGSSVHSGESLNGHTRLGCDCALKSVYIPEIDLSPLIVNLTCMIAAIAWDYIVTVVIIVLAELQFLCLWKQAVVAVFECNIETCLMSEWDLF